LGPHDHEGKDHMFFQLKLTIYYDGPVFQMRGLVKGDDLQEAAVKFLTRELVGGVVRDAPPGSNVHLEVFDLRYDPEGRIDRALFNAMVREGEEEEGDDYELEY